MQRFNALATAQAIVLAGALAACSTSPPPVRTDGDETILLEFVELGGSDVRPRVNLLQDDYDCYGLYPMSGFTVDSKPLQYTVGTTGKRFFTVQADYRGTAAPASCNIVFTFPIQPGGRYRFEMTSGAQGCQTQLTQFPVGTGEAPPLTETRKREPVSAAPPDDQGPWCKPNAPYAGSSRLLKPRGSP